MIERRVREADTGNCSAIINGIEGSKVLCRLQGLGLCLADSYKRPYSRPPINSGECRADIVEREPLTSGELVALEALRAWADFFGALEPLIEKERAKIDAEKPRE
jgi:hypothetical protein